MNAIVASPATAWTTGQYVTLGDGSLAHWGGAAWTSGKAVTDHVAEPAALSRR